MWLLELHISLSILIFIYVNAIGIVFKSIIVKNGWKSDRKRCFIIKKINGLVFSLIPIFNIVYAMIATMFVIIKKEKFDKFIEEKEKNNE